MFQHELVYRLDNGWILISDICSRPRRCECACVHAYFTCCHVPPATRFSSLQPSGEVQYHFRRPVLEVSLFQCGPSESCEKAAFEIMQPESGRQRNELPESGCQVCRQRARKQRLFNLRPKRKESSRQYRTGHWPSGLRFSYAPMRLANEPKSCH